MDKKYFLIICLLCLFACGENKADVSSTEIDSSRVTTYQANNYKVYTINYVDGSQQKENLETISELTNQLTDNFIPYSFSGSTNELKERKEEYKGKSFLKVLSNNFNNKSFEKVSTLNFTSIVTKDRQTSDITIEEWNFNNKALAYSCFDSLKSYKKVSINYKIINWIWLYQNNKLYLIRSMGPKVLSLEMQKIKSNLQKILEDKGKVESIQFY